VEVNVLPVYCADCGAYLAGSWTRHRAGCAILSLIEKFHADLGIKVAEVPEDMREHLQSLGLKPGR
jgi:DNA-directed RNA polymerase subunit N (RpoN/RPB10)